MRLWTLLLLCAAAHAGDIASHIHVVKITTERSTFGGTTAKQTLAAPALCVGPDGLFMAAGFSLDKPDKDERALVTVTLIDPDGAEHEASILGGNDTMRCTFFRLARGIKPPRPVPLAGAPLAVGEKALLLGRHGDLMEYLPWKLELAVEAAVSKPKTYYALRGARLDQRGSIVATADGRLVGFLASRPTFSDDRGMMLGVGSQTVVVVPAAEYAGLEPKKRTKAWLGVNLAPFDMPREEYFNVSGNWQGALVTGITDGSPAARAGIKVHDLLQAIGAFRFRYERPDDWEEMLRGVQKLPLDRPLKCRIVRFPPRPAGGGFEAKPLELTITLAERPVDFADAQETEIKDLGMRVKPATDDWLRARNYPLALRGAVVTRTERVSPAQLGGLRLDDLILAVDRRPVRDPAALVALLAEAKKAKREKILVLVRRGTETRFFAVEPNW